MTRLKFRTLLIALLLIVPVRDMFTQTLTSATVVGTVKDPGGALLPQVTVHIRQPETNAIATTLSGKSGEYRFPFLKPGNYEITADANGLAAEPVRIHLLVGQEQTVDVTLGVKTVQQTVEVNAGNELLQTENGNNLTDFNLHFVENTPVNGGDITNLAFSTPGVRVNVGGGNNNFNVNGPPFSSVLFTYNGADIVEPFGLNNKSGSSNNTLGQNDVAEASVITNAYSAQYGRMAGAQVNYISKSGTNRFHGNLVEVRHPNSVTTRYGHLQGFKRGLNVGQRVNQGDVLGYVGSTGLATGPHLHYEFRVAGVSRDPARVDFGSGEPVPPASRAAFEQERARLNALLHPVPNPAIAVAR